MFCKKARIAMRSSTGTLAGKPRGAALVTLSPITVSFSYCSKAAVSNARVRSMAQPERLKRQRSVLSTSNVTAAADTDPRCSINARTRAASCSSRTTFGIDTFPSILKSVSCRATKRNRKALKRTEFVSFLQKKQQAEVKCNRDNVSGFVGPIFAMRRASNATAVPLSDVTPQ